MLPRNSRCGRGKHKMCSWTLPAYLDVVLEKLKQSEKLKGLKFNKSNFVARAICDALQRAGVLDLDWDGVVARNAELYSEASG